MKRGALFAIVGSTVLVSVAYGASFHPRGAPVWAPWLLALGTVVMLVAMMVLGASRPGRRLGAQRYAFAAVLTILAGAFGYALSRPGLDAVGTPLWLGLPPRAAVIVYGVGLIPLLLLPLAYVLTFDSQTLSESDLARIRAAVRARTPAGDGDARPDAPAEGA